MENTAFYIARRYLISKKGSQAVSFITGLAAFAMMVAVAAMFIIVSVFSGLIELNKEMISNLHADLTISSSQGKTLKNLSQLSQTLSENKAIAHYAKVIEEKAYINYKGNGEIVYLRGVDSAYTQVNPIDKEIFFGHYPSFKYTNEVVMESQLDGRLGIPVDSETDFAQILMPKPGEGIINDEKDIFNRKDFYVVGVFAGKNHLDNYIIAPIELSQELLNLPKNSAYELVLKLNKGSNPEQIKNTLTQKLGSDYIIKTRAEENAAFWKMINTEKLMIYLIFGLVIFITTFNLAGATIIIQLDKKQQARALISMGMRESQLRQIYFNTGALIVGVGICFGLFIGTVICWLQEQYGFFKATQVLPFPVQITWQNYIIVSLTALFFGLLVSWIFSRSSKRIKLA